MAPLIRECFAVHGFKCVLVGSGGDSGECAVPENIHTPPHRRDWNFLGVGGFFKVPKKIEKLRY